MTARFVVLTFLCIIQSGCEIFSVFTSPAQERGFTGFVSDNALRTAINASFLCSGIPGIEQVEFMIHQGRVLLMGVISEESVRQRVGALVRKIKGVKEVIEEITIGHEEMGDYTHDAWIGHRFRTALFFDPNVFSQNYHIRVSDRVLYILGTAQSQYELDTVLRHAEEFPIRRISHYVKIAPKPKP